MEINGNEKNEDSITKYYCKTCDVTCSKLSYFNRH